MTDKKDDQGFDDWFTSHFADGQEKPTPDAGAQPPAAPPQPPTFDPQQQVAPPQFDPPQPPTFDPSLGGAGIPPTIQYPQYDPAVPLVPPVPPTVDFGLQGQDAVATEFIPSPAQSPTPSPGGASTEANALDSLFGENNFREYDASLVSATPPTPPPPSPDSPAEGGDEPPKEVSSLHITMMWVAGSVVAAFALFAFFLVGTKLPMLTGSTSVDPSSGPAPVETERPVGPVAPGTYNWNELLGGECVVDFGGAWQNEYTVVDCSTPHEAQLVIRAAVPVLAGTGGLYPGVLDLQSRMNLFCTDAAVIDYQAASQYEGVQFEASYPPSTEDWDAGRRDYFCFVSLASGDLIEGSLVAPPSDEPAIEEEGTTDEGTEGD